MTDEKRLMSEEDFLSEMRLRTLEAATETNRLLRTDADITESLRDIIVTVRDEIARDPKLFFKSPGGSGGPGTGSLNPALTLDEAKKLQEKPVSERQVDSTGNVILDLVSQEKELIKELITRLFKI